MAEYALNYLALRTSAIPKISSDVLGRLAAEGVLNQASEEGRVFVFRTGSAAAKTSRDSRSAIDLEWPLRRYLSRLEDTEYRFVRVMEGHQGLTHCGTWVDHPFDSVEAVAAIQADFDALMKRCSCATEHPALKADVRVNGGALTLALNVLRRAGKHEVADELEASAQRDPSTDQGLVDEINRLVTKARSQAQRPFSVQISERVGVEIWPAIDDDRIIVQRKGWGYTGVRYTLDGVRVDSFAEGSIESVRSFAIGSDQLHTQAPAPASQ